MEYVVESARNIEVMSHYDVLVAGGGFAGISAALAAAREGVKVCLLEREWLLGGLGTLGLVAIFLPLCDGKGHQVIAGIGEELIRLAIDCGTEESHLPLPTAWLQRGTQEERAKVRFQAQYNPWVFSLKVERLLIEAGVDIRYGTLAVQVSLEYDKITNVIAEDKGGRFALAANAVIDATGDADICKLAHVPVAHFTPGNVLAAWHYSDTAQGRRLKTLGFSDTPDKYKKGNEEQPLTAQRFSGLDGAELSEMVIRSHEVILNHIDKERMQDNSYTIASLPMIPQIRMTRRLVGKMTLHDMPAFQRFEDSIGMTGDWRKCGPIYEIPFGTLCSDTVKNLLVAGRCISVTDDMWDITRAIPTCTVTGQAAGIAAALMRDNSTIVLSELQRRLHQQNAILHLEEMT